jgi:hypothetical protein
MGGALMCEDNDRFRVVFDDYAFPIRFRLAQQSFFEAADANIPEPGIIRKGEKQPLLVYLNNNPVTFLTADYSIIHGDEVIRFSSADLQPFDPGAIQVIDWIKQDVDITQEFATRKGKKSSKVSIHEYLWKHLNDDHHTAVLYDHRVGEAADFVTFAEDGERLARCRQVQQERPDGNPGLSDECPGERPGTADQAIP